MLVKASYWARVLGKASHWVLGLRVLYGVFERNSYVLCLNLYGEFRCYVYLNGNYGDMLVGIVVMDLNGVGDEVCNNNNNNHAMISSVTIIIIIVKMIRNEK